MNDDLLKKEFNETLDVYRRSLTVLRESLHSCSALTENISGHDVILVEALCSRFARSSDILIQKLLGVVDSLEFDERGSPLDRIHRAEKRGFVDSEEQLKRIRLLRNRIVHEYVIDEPSTFLEEIRRLAPILQEASERIATYASTKGFS